MGRMAFSSLSLFIRFHLPHFLLPSYLLLLFNCHLSLPCLILLAFPSSLPFPSLPFSPPFSFFLLSFAHPAPLQCIYFLTRDPEDAIDHFPFPSLLTFNLKKQELTLSFLLPFPSSLPFLPSLFHLPGETERDATIYLGSLGNSYFYWKLSRYYKKQENAEKWQEALKIAISIFENSPLDTFDSERDVSFYLGLPGAHALGSILYFDSGDMKKGKSYVNRLFARFKKPFDHQGLCELLMGLTGYMSCILFLFKYFPTPAPLSSSHALDLLPPFFY